MFRIYNLVVIRIPLGAYFPRLLSMSKNAAACDGRLRVK